MAEAALVVIQMRLGGWLAWWGSEPPGGGAEAGCHLRRSVRGPATMAPGIQSFIVAISFNSSKPPPCPHVPHCPHVPQYCLRAGVYSQTVPNDLASLPGEPCQKVDSITCIRCGSAERWAVSCGFHLNACATSPFGHWVCLHHA